MESPEITLLFAVNATGDIRDVNAALMNGFADVLDSEAILSRLKKLHGLRLDGLDDPASPVQMQACLNCPTNWNRVRPDWSQKLYRIPECLRVCVEWPSTISYSRAFATLVTNIPIHSRHRLAFGRDPCS